MESKTFTDDQRTTSAELMKQESGNLLSEIDRLEKRREMLSSRLKNAMDLAFASVNIEDSRLTRTLTEATVRDSAAMKQVPFFLQHGSSHLGTDKLLSDLVPDDGLPTSQLFSREHHGLSYGTYLTHTSLVCLWDERRRNQPWISRDSRSLRRGHHFVHCVHSLYRYYASDAKFVSLPRFSAASSRSVAGYFSVEGDSCDNEPATKEEDGG